MNTATTPIRLNGEPAEVPADTLVDVLAFLGIDSEQRGVAVAVNGTVVPRRSWGATDISAGDDVEVINAVQGG